MTDNSNSREEARLLAAINKKKFGSYSKPAAKPRPSVVPLTTSASTNSLPSKPAPVSAPAPSSFVRSPSANFGNPYSASFQATVSAKPTSQPTTPTSAPSTPTYSTSSAPDTPVRSFSSSSSSFVSSSPATPAASSSTPSSAPVTPSNGYPSSASSSATSTPTGVQRNSSFSSSPSKPAARPPSGSFQRAPSFNSPSYSSPTNCNAPLRTTSQQHVRSGSSSSSSSISPPSCEPPSRSHSTTSVPAATGSAALHLSYKELDALLDDTQKKAPTAASKAYDGTSLNELDQLISEMHAAAKTASQPTHSPHHVRTTSSSSVTSKSDTQSPAPAVVHAPSYTPSPVHVPTPAPTPAAAPVQRTNSSPRYGATFGSLMEYVEKSETVSPAVPSSNVSATTSVSTSASDNTRSVPTEYPAPVPSSRLVTSRKFSIPPRPPHEDSSDSLLERALLDSPNVGRSPLSQHSSSSHSTSNETEQTATPQEEETAAQNEETTAQNEEMHPALLNTYKSISDMLDELDTSASKSPSRTSSSSSVPSTPSGSITSASVSVASAPTTPASNVTYYHSTPTTPTHVSTSYSASVSTPSSASSTPTRLTSNIPSAPTPAVHKPAPITTSFSSSASSSSSSSATPTPITPKSNPLDNVEAMLSSLEQRTRESVPPSPITSPTAAAFDTAPIEPIAQSSREIRSALEVYGPEHLCAGCSQVIHGRHWLALNKHWHEEHLQCTLCYKPISQYAEYLDKPYCGPCYTKNFLAPRCTKCGDNILDEMVEAVGGQFHVDCFVCAECHNHFPEGVFVESKDKTKVLCESCYYHVEGRRCDTCNQPITDKSYTEILGKTLHPACFKCKKCETPFTSLECYPVDDQIYCYDCAVSIA